MAGDLTNKRRDFEHQTSKRLIDRYAFIATEELNVKSMTASAKGTIEAPGKNVKQKAGLNRGVLDTAPNAFLLKLQYKMEESGGIWVDVPTRQVKPSQTCPQCGHQKKKTLRERVHQCSECGYTADRDEAAARVMLRWGLEHVYGAPVQGQSRARAGL